MAAPPPQRSFTLSPEESRWREASSGQSTDSSQLARQQASQGISSTGLQPEGFKSTANSYEKGHLVDPVLAGASDEGRAQTDGAQPRAADQRGPATTAAEKDELLSHALIKLSSQYHLSEYNQMKRNLLQPVVPPPRQPLKQTMSAQAVLTQQWNSTRPAVTALSITPRKRAGSPTTGLTPTVGKMDIDTKQRSACPDTDNSEDRSHALEEALEVKNPTVSPTAAAAAAVPALQALPGMLPGMRVINGIPVKTSVSHPMNVSFIVPPETLPHFAATLFDTPRAKTLSSLTSPFVIASSEVTDMVSPQSCPVASTSSAILTTPKLGNLMLSSCPGKKVRLEAQPETAAKSTRSAICRDTKVDLARAQGEGASVVVCCLDDAELALLGSPWHEYETAAHELGLKVVRMPMVEGFAPASPQFLDDQLSELISLHTLRGESLLVHCRGGIGRAGLVACCWLIKMGFVGPVLHDHDDGQEDQGARGAMSIVEDVIQVIRRRRSIKSIETPQQVHFLLEYVEYLRAHAKVVGASQLV